MVIQTIKCNTVQQYIEQLSLANSCWWDNQDENFWVFRGQSHTKLIPSLYRKNKDSSKIKYQEIFDIVQSTLIPGAPDLLSAIRNTVNNHPINHPQSERLIELVKAFFIEIYLTENFLLKCNRIRLNTPSLKLFENQSQSINAVLYFYNNLDKILNEFITQNITTTLYLSFFDFNYPESMALARHHSVPSSLLDWSEDPLVAIFFSAFGNKNGAPCVWALNKKYLRCDLGQIEFHEKLSRVGLEFLHIQKGLFTHMIGTAGYYYRTGKWPTLDQYLLKTYVDANGVNYPQNDYIKKIELDKSQKDSLLIRLNKMGINQYTLMPTYDNVGQFVQKTSY